MKRRTLLMAAPLAVLAPCEIAEAMNSAFASVAHEILARGEREQGGAMGGSTMVYELRIYHAVPGKLENLVARFRDHTMKLFADHGIKSVAYWTALDEPVKSSTFFYILEHPSREAAAANWKVFQDDPEWKRVKAKSEENGKLVEKIDSTFLTLTDFSPRLG
jgi:NIPSNAP